MKKPLFVVLAEKYPNKTFQEIMAITLAVKHNLTITEV